MTISFSRAPPLGRRPGHFAEPIIREVLRPTFFDRLQHKTGHEFRLIASAYSDRQAARQLPRQLFQRIGSLICIVAFSLA
jgi:hypothetical protein